MTQRYRFRTWVLMAMFVASSICAAPAQTAPSFEAASVKTNRSGDAATSLGFQRGGRFRAVNEPLWRLIAEAYGTTYQLRRFEIVGIPDSIAGERFDIDAVAEGDPSPDAQRAMLRNLLGERFKLAAHREVRQLPIYTLVLTRPDGRLGEDLHPSTIDCAALKAAGALPVQVPAGQERPCVMMFGPNLLRANGMTISDLAEMGLSRYVNRLVVNQTKLQGPFQWSVKWAADTNPDGVSIFTALQEQLGLKLEPKTGPVEIVVVDHVELPTPD
jgi:uncharacterized protein (TIGR03435 family)